jgi:hypothetical protein
MLIYDYHFLAIVKLMYISKISLPRAFKFEFRFLGVDLNKIAWQKIQHICLAHLIYVDINWKEEICKKVELE